MILACKILLSRPEQPYDVLWHDAYGVMQYLFHGMCALGRGSTSQAATKTVLAVFLPEGSRPG